MKILDSNNQIQTIALINEYKGNLFEFKTALILAQIFKIELEFYQSLNADYKERLTYYEEFLRFNAPELIYKLTNLATNTAKKMESYFVEKKFIPNGIYPVGKISNSKSFSQIAEADIVLVMKENHQVFKEFISLKLSKIDSYTNTKSAGIKSFISKYFDDFKEAEQLQLELNKIVEFEFLKMGAALYEKKGLHFNGQFGPEWNRQFTELPGELDDELRSIVFLNYQQTSHKLYNILLELKNIDSLKFYNSLIKLIGHSNNDLIQVITYHRDHEYESTRINCLNQNQQINFSIRPQRENSHFIEIEYHNLILQLRIKPMNKFTTMSYKINCSIKELK